MSKTTEIKEQTPTKVKHTTVSVPIELVSEIKGKYGPWINLSAFVQSVLREKLSEEAKERSN